MEAHLKRANHLAKLGEKITDMEFVITFTWASILNNRDRVIPYNRKDGQFFTRFPKINTFFHMARDPSQPNDIFRLIHCQIYMIIPSGSKK